MSAPAELPRRGNLGLPRSGGGGHNILRRQLAVIGGAGALSGKRPLVPVDEGMPDGGLPRSRDRQCPRLPDTVGRSLPNAPFRHATRSVTLSDQDVLDWFRKQGKGYQTRMNAVLRAYKEAHQD